jgi:hypothetical protein
VLNVVFRPQSKARLSKFDSGNESRSAGLGEQFTQAMESLILRIAENPSAVPAVQGETIQRVGKIVRESSYAV